MQDHDTEVEGEDVEEASADEEAPAREPTKQELELVGEGLRKLLTASNNAHFEAGDWRSDDEEDSDTGYSAVADVADRAEHAVLIAIAQIARERDLLAETARWLAEEADAIREGERLLADLQFRRAEVQDSAMHVEISGEIVRIMAAAIAMQFRAHAAENYIEMQLTDREAADLFTVTFQRQRGKTPHQLREQAEKERDAALEQARVAEGVAAEAMNKLLEADRRIKELDALHARVSAGSEKLADTCELLRRAIRRMSPQSAMLTLPDLRKRYAGDPPVLMRLSERPEQEG